MGKDEVAIIPSFKIRTIRSLHSSHYLLGEPRSHHEKASNITALYKMQPIAHLQGHWFPRNAVAVPQNGDSMQKLSRHGLISE